MKVKVIITMVVFSVSVFTVATNVRGNGITELTFGQYYEPYEPNIVPNAPGYTLPLDINDIANYDSVNRDIPLEQIFGLIQQNGFAIVELEPYSLQSILFGDADFVGIYNSLWMSNIPAFLTTDTGLYVYHSLFDETLKDIEEHLFISDINNLTSALLNDASQQYEQFEDDLKEAARRNIAYLSVAQGLIDPNASTQALVDDIVSDELAKIQAHSGFSSSAIFNYMEDYSQYVPRGHYTRSEALERYFKTMMWYGRMAFLLKGSENFGQMGEALVSVRDARIQTLQAFLLATSLRNVQVDERTGLDIWDRLYTVTAFYVGIADDLTPYDYLWALDQVFENNFTFIELAEEDNLLALKTELALLPSPKIFGGTGNVTIFPPFTSESLNEVLDKTKGMRLIGQRFIPDSYMFQNLVFPEVGTYIGDIKNQPFTFGNDGAGGFCRAYARGLDIMALLGSNEALKILIDEGDTDYQHFWQRFGELKDEFGTLSITDWNSNLYWSWLYSLKGLLQELPEGYPEFMRTQTWQRRQLNTALASWTQLRHDTILYAKQSLTPAAVGMPPPPPPGYVEPIPVFWGRLLSLTRMTSRGLSDFNVLTPEALQSLNNLEELLQQTLDIVNMQLSNEPPSLEISEFFERLPSKLNSIVPKIDDQHLGTTLVADVHTNSVEQTVVEEAVGKNDLIVVACPMPNGKPFLSIGPVLSYYEFKHPMSDRLTDEAWRIMLNSSNRPDRPKWYTPLILQSEKPPDLTGWTRLTNNNVDDTSPSWSPDGQNIVFESNYDIYIMNADGSEQKNLTNNTTYDMNPSWSPDGQKIAFSSMNWDIYVMNVDGSEKQNLTNSPLKCESPSWSPDGQRIAFVSRKANPPMSSGDIYIMNADGSEQRNLTNSPSHDIHPCWSSDGQKIVFSSSSDREQNIDIYVMNADGSGITRLTNDPTIDTEPSWSPDGQTIAYVSETYGNSDIFLMNTDGSEKRNLTNKPVFCWSPSWSPDGTKIAFCSGNYGYREIYIINVTE